MQPYQQSYDLKSKNLRVEDGKLIIECDRCRKYTEKTKQFKIHPDGAITFSFICHHCQWSYAIYRNAFAEFKKVHSVLMKI